MNDEWAIRRYRPDDRNAVWWVHDHTLRNSAMDYSPEYNRYLRHIDRKFLDGRGEFLVATVDSAVNPPDEDDSETNDVVAIGGFQPLVETDDPDSAIRQTLPRDTTTSTARIRSVAVLPTFQSHGIGTAIVSELEHRAVKMGFSSVVLTTTIDLSTAQRFYESLGYHLVEIRSSADPAEVSDTEYVWYRKELRDGSDE
ncbi:GNAT family N-acetyltransferase [Haladaptatus sp. NG-SE-30]